MKITDPKVQEFIDNELKLHKSFYIEGIAGCGKSSLVRKLRALGYKKVIMLAPTNQLVLRHIERFEKDNPKDDYYAVDNFICETYASVTESADRAKIDYEANDKDIKLDADLFIFDEVFATDVHSLKRMIEHAKKLNKPYILLGDYYQTSINKQKITRTELFQGLDGLILDETMRGNKANRNLIEAMYRQCVKGTKFIKAETLANMIKSLGGNISYEFPTNQDFQYGYTADPVENELVSRIQFKEKIFTGKVRYKQDGDFSKMWDSAPILPQTMKNAVTKFTGIKIPYATARHTMSAITCIGVELEQEQELHLLFRKNQSVEFRSSYTLTSRHVNPAKITIHLIDDSEFTQDILFKKHEGIKVDGGYLDCSEQIYSVGSTDEALGLYKMYEQSKQRNMNVNETLFTQLLEKTGKPFTNETKLIYTDNYKIRPDRHSGHTSIYLAMFFSEEKETKEEDKDYTDVKVFAKGKELEYKKITVSYEPKQEKEKITVVQEKVSTVLGELMQTIPNILCDPSLLHYQGDKFFTHDGLSCFLTLKKKLEPVKQVEKQYSDLELLSDILDDFLDKPVVEPASYQGYVYKIDLKASFWQCLSHYPQYIGYGPLIKYNKDATISYALCKYTAIDKEERIILNSKVIEAFKKLGFELTIVKWLASREYTLDKYLTQELKSHISYCREIRFEKKELSIWGGIAKARFVPAKYSIGEDFKKIIVDNLYGSGMYLFQLELKAIQSLLITAIGTQQEHDFTFDFDGINSNSPLNFEFNSDFLEAPDRTYESTGIINGIKEVKLLDSKTTHTEANLQKMYDDLIYDKKPSRFPEKAKKIKSKLDAYSKK